MAYSNKTQHYELPQYDNNDVPSILTDVNGAYAKIDETMYETAEGVASNTQKVTTLETNVELLTDAVATAQTDANLAKTTADSAHLKIGTMADLKTDVKSSLVGAINELTDRGGSIDVEEIDITGKIEVLNSASQWVKKQSVINSITKWGEIFVIRFIDNEILRYVSFEQKDRRKFLRVDGNIFNLKTGYEIASLSIDLPINLRLIPSSGSTVDCQAMLSINYYDDYTYFSIEPYSDSSSFPITFNTFRIYSVTYTIAVPSSLKPVMIASMVDNTQLTQRVNALEEQNITELTQRLTALEETNSLQRTQIAKLALVNSANLAKSDFKSMTADVDDSGLKAEINKVDLSTLKG